MGTMDTNTAPHVDDEQGKLSDIYLGLNALTVPVVTIGRGKYT